MTQQPARVAVLSRGSLSHRVVVAAAATAAPEAKQAHCTARNVKGAPSKVRRVLDTIRGKSYEEALMILEYMPYRACEPILKCLISAAANAKNNMGMKKSNLFISTAYADMSTPLKRYQPRAQGRGYKILKQSSHIHIEVKEKASE